MSYTFKPDAMYRMPTHFGPATGPRRGPDGNGFACETSPKSTALSVSFLTDREALDAHMPPGFTVGAQPIVNVSATYMTEIDWLAGRGYNILGVSWPAIFRGERDHVSGSFLSVLWENLTDPIITGREELGYSKIYCELPEPAVYAGNYHAIAGWLGFKFMDMRIEKLAEVTDEVKAAAARPSSDGILHYKYMPRTGEWGKADCAYATLTPAATPNRVIQSMQLGTGEVTFHRARWEDLPTQYMIVNAIQALPVLEARGASVVKTIGGKDLSDQRILC
jgi:hypothetical protein